MLTGSAGREPSSRAIKPERDRQRDDGRRGKQHERFGQQLRNQPSAAGAHREARRHFAPPRRRARQQHAGDVAAGDGDQRAGQREQETDEREERRAHGTGNLARAARSRCRAAGWRAARTLLNASIKRVQLRLRLCHSDTPGFSRPIATCHDAARVRQQVRSRPGPRTTATMAIGTQTSVPIRRRPGSPGSATPTTVKSRVVETKRLPKDVGVAVEAALPERMAEHHHRTLAGNLVFIGTEEAPERGTGAEHVEEVARHQRAEDAFAACPRRRGSSARRRNQRPRSPWCGVCSRRYWYGGCGMLSNPLPSIGASDVDHLRCVADAHRGLEQQRVGQAEDRGRGTDADRQRRDRRQREHRAAAQKADGVPEVWVKAMQALDSNSPAFVSRSLHWQGFGSRQGEVWRAAGVFSAVPGPG